VQMGTVGDGDRFDGNGWGWGRIPVPMQLSSVNKTLTINLINHQ